MKRNDSEIEKRRLGRFQVKGHAFASNSKTQFGQIIDMSVGGLKFVFVDTGKWPDQEGEMDIFSNDDRVGIEEIQCRTCWENVLANSISGMTIRERGVEFVDVTADQAEQLEHFLVGDRPFPAVSSSH